MVLQEEKILNKFITHLNKINQLMKSVKTNSEYSVVKGTFITYPNSEEGDLGVYNLKAVSNAKKDNPEEYFKNMNGLINGTELYLFIRENKKIITEVEFNSNNFIIKTSDENITFKSDNISKSDFNFLNYYKFYRNPKFKEIELISSTELSTEDIKEITSQSFPAIKLNDHILRLTHKQFISTAKDVKINMSLYEYDKEMGIQLLNIRTENEKVFISNQYYLMLK